MPDPSAPAEPAPAGPALAGPALAGPPPGIVWAPGRVDLWGPRPPAGKGSWRHRNTPPDPPIREHSGIWGLPDVVFGFFLVLVLNVALAVVTAVVALPGVLSQPGVDGSDATMLLDAVFKDMTRLLTTGPGVLAGGLSMWAAFFLAPWLATRRKGLRSLALDFGFRFSWGRDILMGAALAVGLRVMDLAVTHGVTALGADMTTADNSSIITNLSGPWLFIDAVIVATIGAPIFEELFFRGLVFGAFLKNFTRDRDGAKTRSLFGGWVVGHLGRGWAAWASYRGFLYRWRLPLAVVISSVMFGLLHHQGTNTFGSWYVVGTTTVIGMALAVIRYRTGRLGMAICTHVLFNASGVALALIFTGS
jgi:membrane protease YdiL (CAAX protease family)